MQLYALEIKDGKRNENKIKKRSSGKENEKIGKGYQN
jgi:hypothetical protein